MIADHSKNGHFDPDMFDVRGSFRIVMEATRTHKWLVVSVTAGVLALTLLYVYIWPPIYRVDAMIMAERETDASRDSFYGNWSIFRKDDPRTEIELMTSVPVLKEVIEKEHLRYEDVYHPFMSEVSYLWEKSFLGRNYKSIKAKLFPDPDSLGTTPEQIELGKTIVDMHEGITIQPVGESNVGQVTVKGPSRKVSKIANSLLDVYSNWRVARYQSEAQKAYDVLTEEMTRTGEQLEEAGQKRLQYANEHRLTFDLQKENLDLRQLTDLEAAVASSKQKVASLQASLSEVEKELATEPPTMQISSVTELNTIRENAKLRRFELETSLLQARDHYREDSPEIQEIKGDLAKLDKLLNLEPESVQKGRTEGLNIVQQQLLSSRNALKAQLEGERHGLTVMEDEAAKLSWHLRQVPTMQNALHGLDRDFGLAQETYQALVLKRAQAQASLATVKTVMPSMRIVGYAMPPGGKSWPRTKILYPGALLLGLALGIFAATVTSYAAGRVRKSDVERGHRFVPLYGNVALQNTDKPLIVLPRLPAASKAAAK